MCAVPADSPHSDEQPNAIVSAPFGTKLATWEKRTQWLLMLLALGFLGLYAYEVIAQLQGTALAVVEAALDVIWMCFLADYVIRLTIARNRFAWMKANLIDLASVLLPFLRPLRLVRLITLLTVFHRTTTATLHNKIVIYTALSTLLLVIISSLAILEAERDLPDASITNYGDAIWWAIVTITTVGYGDYTPVSAVGRVITVALMLGGIALIGVITATLASWITDRVADSNQQNEDYTHAKLQHLEQLILELRAELHKTAATNQALQNCEADDPHSKLVAPIQTKRALQNCTAHSDESLRNSD